MRWSVALGVLALASTPGAEEASFEAWLSGVKAEARRRGFKEPALAALEAVQRIPRVIELDRAQPEKKLTFDQYRAIVLSPERVARGRALLAEHRDLLDQVSARYGVEPQFIVSLWGTETKYGEITGSYPLPSALATLAHEGRRGPFFRHELFNALRILDEGHISAEAMLGSWAGAMGQCQFMPSTFLRHAVDFDGDGRKDIWGTRADVFASTAQFLARLGWKRGEPWGEEVRVPAAVPESLVDRKLARTTAQWRALGVVPVDRSRAPSATREQTLARRATLVRPGGATGPAYLVHTNYHALLGWNRSRYFATAVSLLADALVAPEAEGGLAPPLAGPQ